MDVTTEEERLVTVSLAVVEGVDFEAEATRAATKGPAPSAYKRKVTERTNNGKRRCSV